MQRFLVVFLIALAAVGAGCQRQPAATTDTADDAVLADEPIEETDAAESAVAGEFSDQIASAHFETSTPAHEDILAGVPTHVVINFDFDLADTSTISALQGTQELAAGPVLFSTNKRTMRRAISRTAPDGIVTVKYSACWPDRSCHDGQFQFMIDRTMRDAYDDLTGRPEVTVDMVDIAYEPMDIRISKGTKVTWKNSDTVSHYVNTDSHPAHTYFAAQNSAELAPGGTYSITFNEAGYYPYHCSAHADTMIGSILVE